MINNVFEGLDNALRNIKCNIATVLYGEYHVYDNYRWDIINEIERVYPGIMVDNSYLCYKKKITSNEAAHNILSGIPLDSMCVKMENNKKKERDRTRKSISFTYELYCVVYDKYNKLKIIKFKEGTENKDDSKTGISGFCVSVDFHGDDTVSVKVITDNRIHFRDIDYLRNIMFILAEKSTFLRYKYVNEECPINSNTEWITFKRISYGYPSYDALMRTSNMTGSSSVGLLKYDGPRSTKLKEMKKVINKIYECVRNRDKYIKM